MAEPKAPVYSSGEFGSAWNNTSGPFESKTVVKRGGKKGNVTIPDMTHTDVHQGPGFTSDLGFSGGKNIGGFQGSHYLGGSFSGAPGGGEGSPGLYIARLSAKFAGEARQISEIAGEDLVSRTTTVNGVSRMRANGISGHGQVQLGSMGASMTVVLGRQSGEEE